MTELVSKAEVEACPFCGSHDVQIANENYDPCTYKFGHCECGAKGPERLIVADAVAAWNRRTALPPAEEVGRLLAAAADYADDVDEMTLDRLLSAAEAFKGQSKPIHKRGEVRVIPRAALTQGEEK